MNNIEQELKIQLYGSQYNLLCGLTDAEPQLQTNYYFGYDGMAMDVMVRIRNKGAKFCLCYKHRVSQVDGVFVCDERECEISQDLFNVMLNRGIYKSELRQLLDVDVLQDLRYLGSLETLRTKFQLDCWTLEVDKNYYCGITDYELECENSSMQSLNDLASYLLDTYGIANKPSEPKISRFLQALNP